MSLSEIITILVSDTALSELLGVTTDDKRIYPLEIDGQGMSYKYTQLTNDGVKTQDRLEIRVAYTDLSKCYKIMQRVDELLITIGDDPLTSNILHVEKNGGITPVENKHTGTFTMGSFYSVKGRK